MQNLDTKDNGGTFRSKLSLTDAQEHVSRQVSGLPRTRTLTLRGEQPDRKGFDKAASMAELDAIFGS